MSGTEPPFGPDSQQPTSDGAPSKARPPSSASPQGHFEPGQVLARRYRIISLIGKGGMGEVYRADDLELEQVVALKFLPVDLAQSPDRLRRFRGEVRLTRQVSHPNVCRVYDIAEAEGRMFIAMEFIEGEDLASLLRRIGRLPEDKALEIARQLCAGLAAAHDQGVIHRDLKPANIMIDERGRARVTDFGVAAHADDETVERAGTPAYMAPEQLERGEATTRSDVYSLGLVLYELFTGKPVLTARTVNELLTVDRSTSSITSPSSHVTTLDPIVERAIMRCLEPEPSDRPASALAVAASLPGGDPLAHALAAGETPSPQLVAASGGSGAMRPLLAAALLAISLLAATAAMFAASSTNLLHFAKPELSTEILRLRAREHITALGYEDVPVADTASVFERNKAFITHILETDQSVDRWDRLSGERPGGLTFMYRQAARPFEAFSPGRGVSFTIPPRIQAGMISVMLDVQGRIRFFQAAPPGFAAISSIETEPDWSVVFDVTGLDPARFVDDDVIALGATASTVRRAWKGSEAGETDAEPQVLYLSAGAANGKVNHIQVNYEWEGRPQTLKDSDDSAFRSDAFIGAIFAIFILGGGSIFAYRNLKLGRADLRTANRLAIVIFLLGGAAALIHAHSMPPPVDFIFNAFPTYGAGLAIALATWLAYVALEPYARRRIPGSLVGWTRLFSGKFNDPMVGSDVLIGICAACLLGLFGSSGFHIEQLLGISPTLLIDDNPVPVHTISGFSHAAQDVLMSLAIWLAACTWITIMLIVLELIVRIRLIAAALLVILFSAGDLARPDLSIVAVLFGPIWIGTVILVLYKRGLLAVAAFLLTGTLGINAVVSGDLASWYSPLLWLLIAPVILLAIYAYRVATAGQSLFITEAERGSAPRAR